MSVPEPVTTPRLKAMALWMLTSLRKDLETAREARLREAAPERWAARCDECAALLDHVSSAIGAVPDHTPVEQCLRVAVDVDRLRELVAAVKTGLDVGEWKPAKG